MVKLAKTISLSQITLPRSAPIQFTLQLIGSDSVQFPDEESSNNSPAAAWRLALPPALKMVIQRAKSWGNEGKKFFVQQSSSPVKIPNWSQMKNPKKGNTGTRELGKMGKKLGILLRIASYSMCEGIGRTLKGRDLCKLRNAILTQTGFLEE